jgi:hypothetical protein
MGINTGWDEWDDLHLILDERISGFSRYVKNFVMKGYGLVAGAGLTCAVGEPGLNVAYINGYEIRRDNASILGLSALSTNHVFIKFTKSADPVAGTDAITISYEVNTTGIPPADSIKIGEVDTDGVGVTDVRPQNNKYKIHDAQLETDLDCNQLQLLRYTPGKGTAFPTVPPPVSGEHFVRTDLVGNPEFIFDGVMWNAIGTGGAGAQGNQGFQGAGGGAQGNQGRQGNQGNQGRQGNQGLEGAQGNQGFVGTQGSQGPQGNQGNQGNQGLISNDIYAATRVVDSGGAGTDLTIASAIAALPAPGGTIFLKQGAYSEAATHVLPGSKSILFKGAGRGATVITLTAAGVPLFQVAAAATGTYVFRDFSAVGDGATAQKFLDLGSDVNAFVDGVDVTDFRDIVDDAAGAEVVFQNCAFSMPFSGSCSFWRGTGPAGKLVWIYTEATLGTATSDAIVGSPNWETTDSYIGGPGASIYAVGQIIWQTFRLDNAEVTATVGDSRVNECDFVNAGVILSGDRNIVGDSVFSGGSPAGFFALRLGGVGNAIAGNAFNGGSTTAIDILAAATETVISGNRFFPSYFTCVKNASSGAVMTGNSGMQVIESGAANNNRYAGNSVFGASVILGNDSVVDGVRRKSLTAVATTGAFVTQFEHFNKKGIVGIGTIKNTGANSLEVRETVTDAFGVTDSSTTTVPAGIDYMLDPQTNFGTARPPHLSYKVEVQHPGAATTFSLQHATEGAE